MVCCPTSVFVRPLAEWRPLVATGPKGNYVDSSELKPPRLKYVVSSAAYTPTKLLLVDMVSSKSGNLIAFEIVTASSFYATDVACQPFPLTSQRQLQQPSGLAERQVPRVAILSREEA